MSDQPISMEISKSLIECYEKINKNISDTNTMLVSFLEQVMVFLSCEASSILVQQDDGKNLVVSLGKGGSSVKYTNLEDGSLAYWVLNHKQSAVIDDLENDTRFKKSSNPRLRNILAVPVLKDGVCFGVLEIFNSKNNDFSSQDIKVAESLGSLASSLYHSSIEIHQTKESMDLVFSMESHDPSIFVGNGKIIREIEITVEELAKTNATVLISGEKGVGKKIFARKLHNKSARKDKPFVTVKCNSKTCSQLENEIFGYEKEGIFYEGALEKCTGGTFVLEDVGRLPLLIQSKIHDLIQKKSFYNPFKKKQIPLDVRFVALSDEDISILVQKKLFMEELYYQLNVLPLNILPLRKHPEDIKPLALVYLGKACHKFGKEIKNFSTEAMDFLEKQQWPGNLLELENMIERSVISCNSDFIKLRDFFGTEFFSDGKDGLGSLVEESIQKTDKSLKSAVDGFKKMYIERILLENNWNQTAAAKVLDVQRTYVSKLISELGIKRN